MKIAQHRDHSDGRYDQEGGFILGLFSDQKTAKKRSTADGGANRQCNTRQTHAPFQRVIPRQHQAYEKPKSRPPSPGNKKYRKPDNAPGQQTQPDRDKDFRKAFEKFKGFIIGQHRAAVPHTGLSMRN